MITYDLMTFDDMLRDGSSFGKPCTSSIAHLPSKFMLKVSTFTGNFQAYRLIFKSKILLHRVF